MPALPTMGQPFPSSDLKKVAAEEYAPDAAGPDPVPHSSDAGPITADGNHAVDLAGARTAFFRREYCGFTVLVLLAGLALAVIPWTAISTEFYLGCLLGSVVPLGYLGLKRIRRNIAITGINCPFRAAAAAGRATFFADILNMLPIQVAIFDNEGRYRYLNPASVANPAVREWMIGKTTLDYGRERGVAMKPFQDRFDWLQSVIASKRESRHEETLKTHSGETKYIVRVASPILDDAGNVSQVVAYGVDMTERLQFEEELREAKEQAEEMLRLKTAFLNNMSHELRTPLTAILGFSEILAEGDSESGQLAQVISSSAARLNDTLNSVLELARLESERAVLHPVPIDVVPEIDEIAALLALPARDKGLFLEVVHRHPSAVCAADAACLDRIINNLVGNAIKFSRYGGITITTESDEEFVTIRVSDTGIGMTEEFIPHLFDAFRQESSGLGRAHEGVGLGLSITMRLVSLLNGSIDVDSRRGEGSTFTVKLPVPTAGAPERQKSVDSPSAHDLREV